MKIYLTLRALPELQQVSKEQFHAMRKQGVFHSLYMGRVLLVVMLCLPNAVMAQIAFTERSHFWPAPILWSVLVSFGIFLVFNHRELARCREKVRRYLA